MRNFLNFMGKSLMVLVFSFLTLSVVLTSCSPSDDSSEEITQVDLNNLGLDPIYVPDENDLDSYVRRGTSTPIVLLTLEGTEFTFSEDSELVTLGSGGKTLVSSVSQNTSVGNKTITYNVLRNGTSVGSRTLEFDVYYGENDVLTVTATAKVYFYNGTDFLPTPSNTEYELYDIPYQYVSDPTYMFQLCFSDERYETFSNFNDTSLNINEWRIVKLEYTTSLIEQYIVVNKSVRSKTRNDKTFHELQVDPNRNYIINENECGWQSTPTDQIFTCTTI